MPTATKRRRRAARAGSLTVTPEPARANALVEIAGAPSGAATFTLSRTGPSGVPAVVRGAAGAVVGGDPMTVRDYEVPFGVPLVYTCTFYDAAGLSLGTASADFTMPYSEKHRLVLRGDAFNTFNHPNFAPPSSSLSNLSTFGQITKIADGAAPRVLQVALRYEF